MSMLKYEGSTRSAYQGSGSCADVTTSHISGVSCRINCRTLVLFIMSVTASKSS